MMTPRRGTGSASEGSAPSLRRSRRQNAYAPRSLVLVLRDWLRFLVYIFYCVEGGLLLLIVPWRPLWEQNYFFRQYQLVEQIAMHPVARGMVSGLGVALLVHGVYEVIVATTSRREGREPASRRDGEAA